MTSETSLPAGETLSTDVLNAALSELPADLAEQVMIGVAKASHEAKQRSEELKLKSLVFELATITHQVRYLDQAPSNIDAISWDRAMADGCGRLVVLKKTQSQEVFERLVPNSILKFAVTLWTHREFEFGDYDEGELDEILEGTGYTVSRVYGELIDTIEKSASEGLMPGVTDKSRAEIEAIYQTIGHIPIYEIPAFGEFDNTVQADLRLLGYALPVLGSDFTYGPDEEDTYRWPKPDLELLPD